MPYRLLAVVLIALWLPTKTVSAYDATFSSRLQPGDQMTPVAGGPGGAPFVLRCDEGRFLSGIAVQKIAWIHYVEPQCSEVTFNSGFRRSPGGTQFSKAGVGNFDIDNAASARCRDLEFIVFGLFPTRVVTSSGAFLGTFSVACRRMATGFEQEPQSYFHDIHIDRAPDASYVPLGALSCGNGQWAVGIHGGAGLYVDSLGLICAPQTLPPGVLSTNRITPLLTKPDSHVKDVLKSLQPGTPTLVQPGLSQQMMKSKTLVFANQVFANPTVDGTAVDYCLNWASNCGEPAASAFCQSQGFARSVSHTFQLHAPPTLVIGDRKICNENGCTRMTSITCAH